MVSFSLSLYPSNIKFLNPKQINKSLSKPNTKPLLKNYQLN